MSQFVRIVFNGRESEALVYASNASDLPELLRNSANAVNALVHADEDEDEDGAETTTGGYGAGYEANGQILAKLSALLQVAIAEAPQLISEITTLIGLFGGKVPLAGVAPTAAYEANGQILAKLSSLLQAAIANAPQLIAEVSTIIALFAGKTPSPTPIAGPTNAA